MKVVKGRKTKREDNRAKPVEVVIERQDRGPKA